MESGEQHPPPRTLCPSLIHLKASCRQPAAGEADGRDAPQGAMADPGGQAAGPRSCCSGRRLCPARGCLCSKAKVAVRDAQPTSGFQLNLLGEGPPRGPGRPHPSGPLCFHPGPLGAKWAPCLPAQGAPCRPQMPLMVPLPPPLPPRSHSLDIIDPGEVEGRMLAA